jgi:site-specific DNA-methyltransferase (adenine-specific)
MMQMSQPATVAARAPRSSELLTLDVIHHMNFFEGALALPDNSVDLAIIDPPYNTSKGGAWSWNAAAGLPGFGGNWRKVSQVWDDMTLPDYFAFTLSWLTEVKRIVKPTGSIWVHGTYHNAGIINFAMQLLEIEIINEVVWYKRNSFPNLSGRRLTASHETILWAHTGKKRAYYFNYDRAKASAYAGDQLKEAGKQMRTVWDVPNNKDRSELAHGKHPTQKPLRLIQRMIQISGESGQTCLIPFAGSGTECVAARREGLHFIGFEIDETYVDLARTRVAQDSPLL